MTDSRARGLIGAILAALVLATTAIAATVFASARADAAPPKFKVVTRDFANTAPISIPRLDLNGDAGPAEPYPSSRTVAGFGQQGRILDVNVVLRGFGHAVAVGDVDMALIGPGRTGSARIMSDVGGVNGLTDATIVVDDEAPTFMPQNSRLQSGRFQPTNYPEILDLFPNTTQPSGNRALSVFDGKNPNGTWRLFALDDEEDGGGGIDGGWSVTIRARVPR